MVAHAPRGEAKRSGRAVGAVNLLLVNERGEVLLQRRPPDKENGARWDKSVGGHVAADEDFDATVVREASEELFSLPSSPRVSLVPSREAVMATAVLGERAVFYRAHLQHGLRDVRLAPGGGVRNVVYHVAIYLGRMGLPLTAFRPQREEIEALRYAAPDEIDALLIAGQLAPNMAFLWLTQARALLGLLAG